MASVNVEENDLFDPSHEKSAKDLYDRIDTDTRYSEGFLSGKVFMAWPVKNKKLRFNMKTVGNHSFDVELSDVCSNYFDELEPRLKARGEFLISLKGATIQRVPPTSKIGALHMVLKYVEGVVVKFPLGSGAPFKIVDTWKLEEDARAKDVPADDWFSTPLLATTTGSVVSAQNSNPAAETSHSASPISADRHLEAPSHTIHTTVQAPPREADDSNKRKLLEDTSNINPKKKQRLSPSDVGPVIPGDNRTRSDIAAVQSTANNTTLNRIQPESNARPQLSNKKAKKLRKEEKRAAQLLASTSPDNVSSTVAPAPAPPAVPSAAPGPPAPAPVHSPEPIAALAPAPDLPSRQINLQLDSLDCSHRPNDILLIRDIKSSPFNIVGIVTSVRPKVRATRGLRDWSVAFTVVDPSNHDNYDGFMVNCFTKEYEQWLPTVAVGQIVILHGLKPKSHNGRTTGTGYTNKLRWAVFDPETRSAPPPDIGDIPRVAGLADGYGHLFTPFWEASPHELAYCARVHGWWQEIHEDRKVETSTVHQIGNMHAIAGMTPKRIHRLLDETSPSTPPNGFFNCTVEILHVFPHNTAEIYVTDYTRPPGVLPTNTDWSPPALAECILKIGMWDEAGDLARTMQVGDFWYLHNCRVKIASSGFVEGTMSAPEKTHKIDDTDLENEPQLKALLDRKKEYEAALDASEDRANKFEHSLLGEDKKSEFFNCTVELLHKVDGTPAHLWVTDYSHNPEFEAESANAPWSRGLGGRFIKIILWDSQAAMANSMEPGCFFSIKKLKLKKSYGGKTLQGQLGGQERLIHKLQDGGTSSEEFTLLLQRKRDRLSARCAKRDPSVTNAPSHVHTIVALPSIKDIVSSDKCPSRWHLKARVVDFYPLDLEDCVVARCTKCKVDIDTTKRKGCVNCDDLAESHVQWSYRFFLRLEDSDGTHLHVSISNGNCTPLRGLEPTDLREDAAACAEFERRLAPLIGNIPEVHRALCMDKSLNTITSDMHMVIDSWAIADADPENPRGYELVSCEPISQ